MIKLYGTLGPSCCETEVIVELLIQGMTGVRLNLTHTGLYDSKQWIHNLFAAGKKVGIKPELIIDMQGPEMRIGEIASPVLLEKGTIIILGRDGIPVPNCIFTALKEGQDILMDDGMILVRTEQVSDRQAVCRVIRGGILKGRKSIALPGAQLQAPTMTPADMEYIGMAKEFGVTGVMQPFVRSSTDLKIVRQALKEAQAGDIQIFAKLEDMEGVRNLPELLDEADVIVIARGDLGNAMPLWKLPGIQKQVSAICRKAGKPFMVGTQLLYTMHNCAVPTRAEVSDIYNAVLDGASSLIVTGETAIGKYPVEVMRYLYQTSREAFEDLNKGIQ